MTDVLVVGAGPAGVMATLRAADLGAKTALVAGSEFGGMAANDGPVPVRTLAHAGRLLRDARQLGQYGVTVGEPVLDYSRLLARVREVVRDVRAHSSLRLQIGALGVAVHEQTGMARFVDPHTIETQGGLRLCADKVIICTGGTSRRLPIPGFELTSTHSDAWALTSVPPSMLVVGAGATGVQVASIFNAFGSRIELFEAGPRILATEDADISAAAAVALRQSGIAVHESFGTITAFEKTATGVRMLFTKDGRQFDVEGALAVVAAGWAADTSSLNLAEAGVELNQRKFVKVDEYLRTSAPHIFAAGDVTGHAMLVPQAIQAGFVAATNAVKGPGMPLVDQVSPMGSFTEPEYAQAGLTEAKARETNDIVTSIVHFDVTTRTIIDGRKFGFCKLVADRKSCKILGCHVIGERAVDIVEVAAIAIAAGMRVDDLAQIPLAYPTYAAILVRAAVMAAGELGLNVGWQAHRVGGVLVSADH
ncbi:NAD(P)/FAD-dependent oxidoreductase [Bradyrhizobium sp. Arg816]|uniref:dihydrolipoyl dehydrogenase family protein n=1 Tax=Bradyrhizobium sp. Arg816 TaxID=2998491 RepID=UPI00249ED055|nr:NAD(P)/FAD-dependent oxidoreductase [Bradyrhizobium sp. Arg816]MDI3561909.1 NAD(P)/FAD-dependent oxidoreductase [Bradyrhizobium sp. Arg816]